ncbi:MAG TPA: ABC transporter permease [Calditrichia bacterium]|nr:ABC transporter permease [Calditrichota bacterium]HQU71930.1 ABC transporter permease [Calditrichia bacterium]HQV30860.1 ABC transporter permease [Calditrichia bacterium]
MRFIREFLESLRIAFDALRANKARGLLTTLGIVIGIVAVVTTMTAANGLANAFRESISAIGTDVLYVSRSPWVQMGRNFDLRNRPNLNLKESEKLSAKLVSAQAVNPTTGTNRQVKFQSKTIEDVNIVGTTDRQMMVSNSVPEYGRFLTAFDVQSRKNVCVIGHEVKNRLFGSANPINQDMRIGRRRFRVVGVMEKQGTASFFGGPNFDMQVFVPVTSFVKAFGSTNRNFNFAVKAPSQEAMADFEYELVGEMRKIRRLKPAEKDNFSINQMNTLLDAYNNVMGVIVMVGLLITSVSLFVGGIGVMNIMFVSVTERTREIGIRKAIGARRRTILAQFLFEASTICLIGGLVAILLSMGVTALINNLLMPASISMPIVVVALAVAAGTGILAGLIPAIKASRLNPIEALRYE